MRTRAVIGRTMAESTAAFEPHPRPPAGAPNVLLIVLDDLGFAQLGCFGSDIGTPCIDGVAARGLRFNHFHNHYAWGWAWAGIHRCACGSAIRGSAVYARLWWRSGRAALPQPVRSARSSATRLT